MFEQDYIMRLIHEIVRMVLKTVFHIETQSPLMQYAKEQTQKTALMDLLELVDAGYINEAENQLYSMLDGDDRSALETALLFYGYLNEIDDSFLTEHGYTRKEISEGLLHATNLYGLGSLTDLFLS